MLYYIIPNLFNNSSDPGSSSSLEIEMGVTVKLFH